MINIDRKKGTVSLEVSISDIRRNLEKSKLNVNLSDNEYINIIAKALTSFEKGHESTAVLGINGMVNFYLYSEGINKKNKKLLEISTRAKGFKGEI